MKYEIVVPNILSEGRLKLQKWHVDAGKEVNVGDLLCEISSGKANKEVYSEYKGIVEEILVPQHSQVKAGQKLLVIEGEEGQAPAAQKTETKTAAPGLSKGYFDIKLKKAKKELNCDIAILGGGPGGYVAAIRGAQKGRKVVLIERDRLGGTCLNRGCIPTKAIVRSVEVLENIKSSSKYGLGEFTGHYNYKEIIERKDEVVGQLVNGIKHLMNANGITLIYGDGKFKDRNTLEVDGKEFDATIKAKNIIIATGSRPANLPIPGAEGKNVINSTQLLDMKELPSSMIIIGGGVIGMEFAFILNSLGVQVYVVEMMPNILPLVDKEIADEIKNIAENKGIKIYTSAKVIRIEEVENAGSLVIIEKDNGSVNLVAEKVFISIGRALNTENIGLEEIGVEFDRKGIKVDETLRTNIDNIFAIGDVNGKYMLAHVASMEGIVAIDNIVGESKKMKYSTVPSVIFTSPEIAAVGLTEQEAMDKGYEVKISKFPYQANGKALTMGEEKGFVKIVADREGKILGGWIIGHNSSDLIPQITLAMDNGLTAEDISSTIYAHPTISECVQEACHGVLGHSIHF
jgi:dihydrolipoamide dehydrogenase